MMTIKNVNTLSGKIETLSFKHETEQEIDAEGKWISIPGLIDAHVHFSIPGPQSWREYAKKALCSGVTRVFDLPTGSPDCFDLEQLQAKKTAIDAILKECDLPLSYQLYLGAGEKSTEALSLAKPHAVAVYVSFDPGSKAFVKDQGSLERVFQLAAQKDLMIASSGDTKKAIALAEKYGAQTYLLNIHSEIELNQVREAKDKQLLIYTEATLYHLFQPDSKLLWQAIEDGTIDSVGSNADHFFESVGSDMLLPLLLHAVNEGKLTLEKVVQLTRINIESIYGIDRQKDCVLIDMEREKIVTDLPFWLPGNKLKGWPVYTAFKDKLYKAP